AGPAGTASIDGTDAWTITATSKNPDLAQKLIEFYLDPEVQKRQVLDTGWLPIRLSTLADPEVQKAAPNAAIVLEQAKHPYDSFVTPDYTQVTTAIGTEIQKALQGGQSAKDAIQSAWDQVTAIVKKRSKTGRRRSGAGRGGEGVQPPIGRVGPEGLERSGLGTLEQRRRRIGLAALMPTLLFLLLILAYP